MMIKPGITSLDKCVDSRYTLVSMAAKRARMIGKEKNADEMYDDGEKPVTVAVNEIMDGKVGYVRSGRIKTAQEWEDEKFAAIQNMSEEAAEETEVTSETEETEEIEAETTAEIEE